jgi:G-protein signaling modulator 2
MEASCRQLACEGERLMKNHDYEGAIEFFEAGLRAGTDQNDVLSAIYNQLGNACFYVGKYDKALEYHKKDLDIAEKIGDRQGMAKAYGNLGNTFKALKNFANAQKCCELHLDITRQLGDVLGEGRACYNLGNVHHAIGKMAMSKRTPQVSLGGERR